jgi:TonB-dependent receptor
MRLLLSSLAFAIAVTILGLTPAMAQVGGITGTVKDATGAVLPGARVDVQQGPSAVSDAQGQFLISRLASGNYKVTVSYVGFSPFETSVTVTAPQIAQVDAVLNVESASQVVTVSGDRQLGEVEAINIESTADNIVQVLPSKVITSLPNTNVADAVGRIPSVSLERDEGEGKYVQIRGTEPRLSNLTINGVNVPSPEGNVRNIKMDIIPSGIIEFIEVNKTLSANQDGDAIGGSVNLVTKTASERPTFDFEGQGGYTNIVGGRWLDAFNGTAGQRFGARKQWGFLLGGTYDWNGRGINDLEPAPGVTSFNGVNYPFFAGEDLRTYKYYRTRYGFAPEIDYVIKPGSSVYLKGLYSDFHDYGETWVYTPNAGALAAPPTGSLYHFDNTGSMQYRHYVRRPDQQIYSGLTGGRHDLTSSLITYEFAVSRAHNIGGQDFATTKFNNTTFPGIQFDLNTSDPHKPKFLVQNGVNIYDPTQYNMSQYTLPHYSSSQLNFQGATSYARRYSTHEHYGTFELGLKVRNAHKSQYENDQIFDNPTINIPLSSVLGTFSNPTYYDKAYKFGPMSDYGKINQVAIPNLSQLGYDANASVIQSLPAIFDANERIYAGYLMNTIGFGKLTVQAGVRFEATGATYRANALQFDVNKNPILPATSVTGSSSYVNVLPSIQLQYRIQQNTNIRGSFGIGISRPNFSDIVPSKQTDPNTSPYPSIVVGNPALKPTRGNNYDILVEHYFRPVGILQAGFFYKTLSDPIYPTRSRFNSSSAQCAQFSSICDVLQSINGPSGHITGFEASWEQRLSFLPGLLNGFGVAANYSYTTSRVTFPTGFNAPASDPTLGRSDHPHLQRQAPNNYNLGLTYDKSRVSLRFAMSHNDASIYSYFWAVPGAGISPNDPVLGLKGPNGDQYLYAHTQYDVQGSVRVGKGFSVVAYGLNLSNEVFGFYQGSSVYPIQREFYHPTFSLGVKWTSAAE